MAKLNQYPAETSLRQLVVRKLWAADRLPGLQNLSSRALAQASALLVRRRLHLLLCVQLRSRRAVRRAFAQPGPWLLLSHAAPSLDPYKLAQPADLTSRLGLARLNTVPSLVAGYAAVPSGHGSQQQS